MAEETPAKADVAKAKQAAVKLLGHRARPRRYLEDRLRNKGLPPAAIQSALDALSEAGYVDDQQYASDRIEGLLNKSLQWGPALVQKLIRDGLDPHVAEEAVANRLADEDQRSWAVEVARERMRTTKTKEPEAERRRLGAYLGRRGFDHTAIIAALEEVLPQSQ